ncbi:kinase-like domain-containing protein [Mycena maculata]|uniref:Kinase-like domain-containing protein n=1 Tax=Mycena maculata TaxID=230809 RepID=A0AAD7H9R8_9AGAR|nr:kinase-like domain-containing protein [Mycena maculata]
MAMPPLPVRLQPANWAALEEADALELWQHYRGFLLQHGYHIMDSEEYLTLGKGAAISPPAVDPFNPKDTEFFVYSGDAPDMLSTRLSAWQPCVEVCFGMDHLQRPVVFKALLPQSTELTVLRFLTMSCQREDKRNRVIPILDFLDTTDLVIVVMPSWGFDWHLPPCGNASTRADMAIQLTEGLQFLHDRGIAHGDIHVGNILFNHGAFRPFHERAPEREFRLDAKVAYAFIDFGSASIFSHGDPPFGTPITVPPESVRAPEQADPATGEINLFAADVYNLGKVLEIELAAAVEHYGELQDCHLTEYSNLLADMTNTDPCIRPTAAVAFERIYALYFVL